MILAISTSTDEGSIALADGDTIVAERVFPQAKGHAEQLLEAIDALVASRAVGREAIRRVVVDVGPGSFTGIRVGVATALGLAHGLGVACDGVGSLAAMGLAALARTPGKTRALSVLDAKKAEVYLAVVDASGTPVPPRAMPIVARDEVERLARENDAVVVGFDAEALLGLAPMRDAAWDRPRAAALAWVARTPDLAPHVVPPVPVYVRAADAVVTVKVPRASEG